MSVPGIDLPRLVAWLDVAVPAVGRPSAVELISGGKSNLTYRLTTPARDLVLRRPPLGHVLPTAHDMGREWRAISALYGTAVPVPEPIAFCADEDVIGAHFYLMGFTEGAAIRTSSEAAALSPREARLVSAQLADVLAAIHTVDYEQLGLGSHGRPEGYLARQLKRWGKQWASSQTRPLAVYDHLVTELERRLPAAGGHSLVHGDYRLDNVLVRLSPAGPEITAVVDWEMSTLGDPLADVGLTLTYWQDPEDAGSDQFPVASGVTTVPGFLTAAEFADRYASAAGVSLGSLDYYIAFGHFKLAVIMEGIHARFAMGKTVGEGFDHAGDAVPLLLERAMRILEGAR